MSRRIGIAAGIWAVGILLSRVIGLVREAVFGRVVGGGTDASVYFTAFTIPDFLNHLLAAGALSIVFIPLFSRYIAEGNEDQGWRAFSSISTFVGLLAVAVTALAWLAVPTLDAYFFGQDLDAEALALLDGLTRLVLPAQIFHVLGGLLSAALQAKDRHALPAMAPLVYTGSIIAGGVIGHVYGMGPWGFAWGVVVGSVMGPFGLPLIGCLRMGLRYRPRLAWDQDLKTYLWQSLPIMLAFSIIMWDDWLIRLIGVGISDSAIATLSYAKQIMRVPMGVFGLALGAAAYPTLARLVNQGQLGDAYTTLSRSLRQMLVLALGAQVAFTVAGEEIARVIYGDRLVVGQHEAIGQALAVFSLALWAWAAHSVLARGFYAMGKTWIPSLLGSGIVLLAWPLYPLLGGWLGTTGLAVASTLAVSTYVLGLALWLRRSMKEGTDQYGAYIVRIIPAVAIAIGAGWAVRWGLGAVFDGGLVALLNASMAGTALSAVAGEIAALTQGAVLCCSALLVYGGAVLALRVPGAIEVVSLIRRKLGR
ncbi:MAG: murein biosynthesis integral membrane protein MurJ [Myxococcota bacterium]